MAVKALKVTEIELCECNSHREPHEHCPDCGRVIRPDESGCESCRLLNEGLARNQSQR